MSYSTDATPQLPTQISRKSLSWLFAIQIFILVPHFITVPLWIAAVWLVVAIWRWQIFQGVWDYPNKIIKTIFVLGCTAGLILTLGVSFNLQSMESLLVVGFILKLLEMKTRKDFVLLIFIALFILATQFIEFNHFPAAAYGIFCLVLLFTTLLQQYQSQRSGSLWMELRPSLFIVLQAIPFMIILFLVIPRLGSFWAVPSPQQAKTGMTDSLSPGDISELIQSNELAFRVTFEGDIPRPEKLYWRGLVLSFFDGQRWSQEQEPGRRRFRTLHQTQADFGPRLTYVGEKVSYEVVVEPTGQTWLYTLAAPQIWSSNVAVSNDLRVQAYGAVTQRLGYRVTSVLDYRLAKLDDNELKRNLELPGNNNPKTRQLAREWLAETGSTGKLVEKLFSYYNKSFFYTLRPPALGSDVVDEFMWQSRLGFCEHFATSFVFFMRAAGVPARVVVGYQGGELNSIEGYLSVRQRDAHAWAEIWFEDRGWVSVDPTAAVAPERIQSGIASSLDENDQKLLGKSFGSSLKILMRMRDQWDALNFQWTRWVMNYDSALQSKLLTQLLSDVSPWRIALFVLGAGLVSLLFVLSILFLRTSRVKKPLAEVYYQKLCKKLSAYGFQPLPGETPTQFLTRIINARPDLAVPIGRIMQLYEKAVYGDDSTLLTQLHDELREFSPRKKSA